MAAFVNWTPAVPWHKTASRPTFTSPTHPPAPGKWKRKCIGRDFSSLSALSINTSMQSAVTQVGRARDRLCSGRERDSGVCRQTRRFIAMMLVFAIFFCVCTPCHFVCMRKFPIVDKKDFSGNWIDCYVWPRDSIRFFENSKQIINKRFGSAQLKTLGSAENWKLLSWAPSLFWNKNSSWTVMLRNSDEWFQWFLYPNQKMDVLYREPYIVYFKLLIVRSANGISWKWKLQCIWKHENVFYSALYLMTT